MGMFNTRQPRGFRRVSIYTDDRKEKLQKLVDEVKRQEGESVEDKPYDIHKFRGIPPMPEGTGKTVVS